MTKYRKKPVIIEATQIKASDFDNDHPNPDHICGVIYDPTARVVLIPTLEGEMRGNIGDWIITGVKGEKYPCKPDIFAATYEPADSTSPAPGAAAMREAAANYALDRARDHYEAGRVFVAHNVKQLSEEIRALPAPEVPGEVRAWVASYDDEATAGAHHLAVDDALRDWIRKEYGL